MAPLSSNFSYLFYEQIASTEGRAMSLDERPALYAWYRAIGLSERASTADEFLRHIDRLLGQRLSALFKGTLGGLYSTQIQEIATTLPASKAELLSSLAHDEDARRHVSGILDRATFVQSPLSIGKASNLRRRVGEHLNQSSDLATRLRREAGISMSDCILRFQYVPPFTEVPGGREDVILLIEDILTRISPAAFVRKSG